MLQIAMIARMESRTIECPIYNLRQSQKGKQFINDYNQKAIKDICQFSSLGYKEYHSPWMDLASDCWKSNIFRILKFNIGFLNF